MDGITKLIQNMVQNMQSTKYYIEIKDIPINKFLIIFIICIGIIYIIHYPMNNYNYPMNNNYGQRYY